MFPEQSIVLSLSLRLRSLLKDTVINLGNQSQLLEALAKPNIV